MSPAGGGSKDFEAMLAAQVVRPLSPEDREKLRKAHGHSWKLSTAARYEATIRAIESEAKSRRTLADAAADRRFYARVADDGLSAL